MIRNLMCAAAALTIATPAMAADVVIGVPNWPSAAATANILKVIIEDNLGLEVELQNGTNPIVFEAMDKGSMHAHPEVWLPNQQNLHDTYRQAEKGTRSKKNPNGVAAFQGMCVDKATADAHDITFDRPDSDRSRQGSALFDSDGDGQGRGLDRRARLGLDQCREDPREAPMATTRRWS